MGSFVATQVARKVAQWNIACHRHSSQYFGCRNRCEKQKSVLLCATPQSQRYNKFMVELLHGVTSSLQLLSPRSASLSNEITSSNACCYRARVLRKSQRDKLQLGLGLGLPSITCLKHVSMLSLNVQLASQQNCVHLET